MFQKIYNKNFRYISPICADAPMDGFAPNLA